MLTLLYALPALLLGWVLGGNDAANVFGPAVTTGVLRFRTAVLLAGAFVLLGAGLQGHRGVATYGALTAQTPLSAALVSLSAALAVLMFLLWGLPVSVTQAVVGALVGLGIARAGLSGVDWGVLLKLALAWTAAPLGAGLVAYGLYRAVQRGLEPHLMSLPAYDRLMGAGFLILCAYGAYALGANNVANVIGPYVAANLFDPWIGALLGGASIAVGMATASRRVLQTVGVRIAQMTPFGGLVVLATGAIMLHLYALLGVPVSASQTVVGGIVGVGWVKGSWTINRPLITRIGLSWFGAPLLSAGLAASLAKIMLSLP